MYDWTQDKPSGSKVAFSSVLKILSSYFNPLILEIGSCDGDSIKAIHKYLPFSVCYSVDDWILSPDEASNILVDSFSENRYISDVKFMKGNSYTVMRKLENKRFHFIHINSSRGSEMDISYELLVAWRIILVGGILGINNTGGDSLHSSTEHFIQKHQGEFEVISNEHNLFIRKLLP
jgi:hypothetical protein